MLSIEDRLKFAEWCRTEAAKVESSVKAVAQRGEDTKPLLKDAAAIKRVLTLLVSPER